MSSSSLGVSGIPRTCEGVRCGLASADRSLSHPQHERCVLFCRDRHCAFHGVRSIPYEWGTSDCASELGGDHGVHPTNDVLFGRNVVPIPELRECTFHKRNVQHMSDGSRPSTGCNVPLGGTTGGSGVGADYKLLDWPIARNREGWGPDIVLNYHG